MLNSKLYKMQLYYFITFSLISNKNAHMPCVVLVNCIWTMYDTAVFLISDRLGFIRSNRNIQPVSSQPLHYRCDMLTRSKKTLWTLFCNFFSDCVRWKFSHCALARLLTCYSIISRPALFDDVALSELM